MYVSIAFEVNLEVGGTVGYSSGNFGVKANLTRGDTSRIVNHRCFPQEHRAEDALKQVFQAFKLPFIAQNIAALENNDLLEFEFLGSLSLGLGLIYGLSAVQLGGRSIGEIGRSLDTIFGKPCVQLDPSVEAAAAFAVSYAQEDAFRFVFAQEDIDGKKNVAVTLLRKDRRALTTKESVGVTVDPGVKFDFGSRANDAVSTARDRVVGGNAGGGNAIAATRLKQKLVSDGKSAVHTLTEAINESVNSLFATVFDAVNLELIQARVHTDVALFRFHFDLDTPGILDDAVKYVMQGNIAGAAAHPGVELDPGAFVEREFIRRSTLGFQFFDLWKWNDVLEYIDRVDVVYAGNGYLRLIGLEGVKHSSGVVGHESECEVHFLAESGKKFGDSATSNIALSLHFSLVDSDANRAQETVGLLNALGSAPILGAATEMAQAFQTGCRNVRTTAVFAQETFQNFKADIYIGSTPGLLPHSLDAANYELFADAVRHVNGQFQGFPRYEDWALFNRVANDKQGSNMIPDRRNAGNLSVWPDRFLNVPDSKRNL